MNGRALVRLEPQAAAIVPKSHAAAERVPLIPVDTMQSACVEPLGIPVHTKLLHESHGQRTFAAVLETGEEAMAQLTEFARKEQLSAAQITAIGAFKDAVVTYFDWETKKYLEIPVDEQVEVASLLGDIGVDADGRPALHIHLVLGRRDGTAVAGHLLRGHVRPTLEVVITETPSHLRRCKDQETGLNLIKM